jgi:hypothetical protein
MARFRLITPSEKMNTEVSKVRTAPPEPRAEFEVIEQPIAETFE